MRAAYLTQQGFELRDVERPVPGEHELLVRTVSCGVCGGDVHVLKTLLAHEQDEQWRDTIMGHEASGIVEEVGSAVQSLKAGDAVTIIGGGFADYVVVTPEQLVTLPDAVDPRWGLGEPVACCVHAMMRSGIRLGDRVAVLGCGFMGLVCLQLASLMGAGSIAAFDLLGWRLEKAGALGANDLVNSSSGTIDASHDDSYDVVIEAAGVQPVLDLATRLVSLHGSILLVGYHQNQNGLRTIPMERWNYKAIDVINGHIRRDDEKLDAMRRGIALMGAGKLKIDELVSYYPLEQIQQVFQAILDNTEGLLKACILPAT